jgi:hypothetical protein
VFVLFAKAKGISYDQIINQIMDEALMRLGLIRPAPKKLRGRPPQENLRGREEVLKK